ncbi:MAG: FtsX-like permease family protein, partial [Bryobacteraceae bacterium]
FGVLPALRVCRGGDARALREGGRSGVGGRRERLRSALVTGEIAASMVLLVAAGLLLRALWRVQSVDPGFRTENVLTLRTALPMPKYDKTVRRNAFYTRVLEAARQIPGATGAAYISFLPMAFPGGVWPVAIDGQAQDESELRRASLRFVTPGFFATLGVPVLLGRDVGEQDTRTALFAAVVSESFVRRYFPHENPLGHRFQFGFADREIVGVAGNIRVRGLEGDSEPQVYLPYKQVADGALEWYAPKDLVVKSITDPVSLLPTLRRAIQTADAEQPVADVRMLADIVDEQTAPRQTQLRLLSAFAAIAFLLAGIGIHGLLSFAVASRTQEIGVRIALGARSGDILLMVLREGSALAATGVVLGALLAYAAGRTIEALLAGVRPGDIAVFAASAGLSLLMTLAGSLLPALRAVHVDPTTAIRAE